MSCSPRGSVLEILGLAVALDKNGIIRTKNRGIKMEEVSNFQTSVTSEFVDTHTKTSSKKAYSEYDTAHNFAKNLNLKSRKEWREYVKGLKPEVAIKPEFVPAHPDGIYKNKGWQGWKHWLGTDRAKNLN